LHPFYVGEFVAEKRSQVVSVLTEDFYQQVKGSRGHHQVGDLLKGRNLAGGDLQAGRLDDDADDSRGPQAQEVRVYHTDNLENSLPS
jgi:hypothetical protein